MVPVYKSGDKSSVSNCRPISLLCILSKVLERIVYNNIINCVKEQSTKHRFSFLPKRSTLQQLPVFAEKVIEPNKCEVDVVYMDFKKVFDSVSHNHLLDTLQTFGIAGKARSKLTKSLYNCVTNLLFSICSLIPIAIKFLFYTCSKFFCNSSILNVRIYDALT